MSPPGISNTADSHHTNQHCAPGKHREAQLFQGRLLCLSRMKYRIDLGVGALVHAVADDLKIPQLYKVPPVWFVESIFTGHFYFCHLSSLRPTNTEQHQLLNHNHTQWLSVLSSASPCSEQRRLHAKVLPTSCTREPRGVLVRLTEEQCGYRSMFLIGDSLVLR